MKIITRSRLRAISCLVFVACSRPTPASFNLTSWLPTSLHESQPRCTGLRTTSPPSNFGQPQYFFSNTLPKARRLMKK